MAFLKYLRDAPASCGGDLQLVALDMLAGRKENTSLRGQAVGFFATLDQYLRYAAKRDASLDLHSFEALKDKVQNGLAYTKADEEAAVRRIRSEAAKRRWKTRASRAPRRRASETSRGVASCGR